MRISAKRSRRTYNLRRIKATFAYAIPEVAALLGVHKNAVIQWGKQGLTIDRSGRPHLVRGSDLQRFLETRQRSRKHRCRAEEFYCFKCRAPREAALGIADLAILSPTRMRLSAICASCESRINKVQAVRDLPKVAKAFHLQELRGRHLL